MSSQPIEYSRFHDSESCTEVGCYARRYYIEDGKKFCQRGHGQDGFTQTQQEEDDFIKQGVTTRKKGLVKEPVSVALRANEAKELYLKCLQLILWKQCYWLITQKGFHEDFETTVRDLWTLRIGIVWRDEVNGYSSQNETDQGLFSSQSEVDLTWKGSGTNNQPQKEAKHDEKLPGLAETLVLCYLGMVLMRLPISLGEIINWAIRYEILYLRAIRAIPKQMRLKLPARFQAAIELNSSLNGLSLYRKTLELIQFFNIHYEMIFPSLNLPSLLYKHIRDLGLPVEVYPAVKILKEILDIDFKFPIVNSATLHPIIHPEVRLISLIVIATKLCQPLDRVRRYPESDMDSSLLKLNWEVWSKTMTEKDATGLKRGEEINLKESDVWNLKDNEIDQYFDWFQQIWIDDRKLKLSERILDLFPLQDVDYQQLNEVDLNTQIDRLKHLQSGLLVQKAWPPGSDISMRVRRPGELYKRYRKLEELNEHAKAFYTLAASHIGISLKTLVKAVFKMEIQVEAWVTIDRKKNYRQRKKDEL